MKIELHTVRSGFDYKTCWVSPYIAVADDRSLGVMALAELTLTGSDVFAGTHFSYTQDMGRNWTPPEIPEIFSRQPNAAGGTSCYGVNPIWHSRSKRFLGFCQLINYSAENVIDHSVPRLLALSVLNAPQRLWSPPAPLELPPAIDDEIRQIGLQAFELDNGDILLPICVRNEREGRFVAYSMRLRIEESRAVVVEYGKPLTVQAPRGLYEPCLMRFAGRYYMTLRNDITGYAAHSDDGMRFETIKPWCFDDGELLGNYNTQQRWVNHADKELFLVYTRRNADNDHVFRHRAPLFIAQVDSERLCVLRHTERILVPNRGARLGNFGLCHLSGKRAWLTVAEWMQNDTVGFGEKGARYCAGFGSDNSLYLADIQF